MKKITNQSKHLVVTNFLHNVVCSGGAKRSKQEGGISAKWEKDVVQCESVPETIKIGPTYCKFFSLMRNVEKFCHFQPIFTKKPNFDTRSQIYK
jgi:hypothetical protein